MRQYCRNESHITSYTTINNVLHTCTYQKTQFIGLGIKWSDIYIFKCFGCSESFLGYYKNRKPIINYNSDKFVFLLGYSGI